MVREPAKPARLCPGGLRGWAAQRVRSSVERDQEVPEVYGQQKSELVLASLRGQKTIAELCREHAISETLLRVARAVPGGRG